MVNLLNLDSAISATSAVELFRLNEKNLAEAKTYIDKTLILAKELNDQKRLGRSLQNEELY